MQVEEKICPLLRKWRRCSQWGDTMLFDEEDYVRILVSPLSGTRVTESAECMATDDQLRVATLGNTPLGVLTARSSMQRNPNEKRLQAMVGLATNIRRTIEEK